MGVALLQTPFFPDRATDGPKLRFSRRRLFRAVPPNGHVGRTRVHVSGPAVHPQNLVALFYRQYRKLGIADLAGRAPTCTITSLYEGQMSHVYSFFFGVAARVPHRFVAQPAQSLEIGVVGPYAGVHRADPSRKRVHRAVFSAVPRSGAGIAEGEVRPADFRSGGLFYWRPCSFFGIAAATRLLEIHLGQLAVLYLTATNPFFGYGPKSDRAVQLPKGVVGVDSLGWLALVEHLFLCATTSDVFLAVVGNVPLCLCTSFFRGGAWWYGGSFGMRPMIDVLPILAIHVSRFFCNRRARIRLE